MHSAVLFTCGYALLGFCLTLALVAAYIRIARHFGVRQVLRETALSGGKASAYRALHASKSGTPSGAGVAVVLAVLAVVLFSRGLAYFDVIPASLLQRSEVYLPLFTLLCMGCLGFFDDLLNAYGGRKRGLGAWAKMAFTLSFALLGAAWFFWKLEYTTLSVPFVGGVEIGAWAMALYVLVITGTANAVNITDGLDGLAGGLLAIAFVAFAALAGVRGHEYLMMFCVLIAACLLAFLFFNAPPASVFMGDSGSLALGATLGVTAMMIDAVAALILIGLPFVIETLSVIAQLFWKRVFGRKLLRISPLHHHFEALGVSEASIVFRALLAGAVCAAAGLALGILGWAS